MSSYSTAATLLLMCLHVDAQTSTILPRAADDRFLGCSLSHVNRSQCDMTRYIERITVFSAPGIIIAGLLILAMPLYLLSKYACNCCGGRYQSPNFCCPSEHAARYSKGDLVRPRVVAVIAFLGSLAGFIWGYVRAGQFADNLTTVANLVNDVPNQLRSLTSPIRQSLIVQMYNATTQTTTTVDLYSSTPALVSATTATLDQLTSIVTNSIGLFGKSIQQYTPIPFIVFALPVAVMLVGLIFAFCCIRRYGAMIVVWLLFFSGILIWLLHAAMCGGSMAVGDGCRELSGAAYDQANTISALINCQDSLFQNYRTVFSDLRSSTTQNFCQSVQPFCYDGTLTVAQNRDANQVFVCPDPYPLNCAGLTFGQLTVWVATAFYIHPNINADPTAIVLGYRCSSSTPCNITDCQNECSVAGVPSAIGRISRQLVSQFNAAKQVSVTLDTYGYQFSTCSSIVQTLSTPFLNPCTNTASSFTAARHASGLTGLCCIMGIFAFAWGAKRFIPLSESEKPQTEAHGPLED